MAVFFCQKVEAQPIITEQTITQFLPHFVAGKLLSSEFNSTIFIDTASSETHSVTLEIFDDFGRPVVVSTDKGVGYKFVVDFVQGVKEQEELEILKNNSLVTGWIRVISLQPISLSLKFQQFEIGASKPIGQATVFPSPVRNVLVFQLDPENAVALVNPSRQDATVTFTAFDRTGQKIKEGSFVLARGAHFAVFFREAPFFVDGIGKIVIASNIALSGIVLDFDGTAFNTILPLKIPRKFGFKNLPGVPGDKIGVACFEPSDRICPKELVAYAANEAFAKLQEFLDRETPLNGSESKPLPIDRDEYGFPKVLELKGKKTAKEYLLSEEPGQDWLNGTFNNKLFFQEMKTFDVFSDYSLVLMFVDTFFLNEGSLPTGFVAQASIYSPFCDGKFVPASVCTGKAFVSSLLLPFLKRDLLLNTDLFLDWNRNTFVGDTYGHVADFAFYIVFHEFIHAATVPWHSGTDWDWPLNSVMNIYKTSGMFRENGTSQAVLTPADTALLSIAPALNPEIFHWVKVDQSRPVIKILSKEFFVEKKQLRVIISVEEEDGGIRFVAADHSKHPSYQLLYFRELTHEEGNNIEMVIPVSGDQFKEGIAIHVFNHQGFKDSIRITP